MTNVLPQKLFLFALSYSPLFFTHLLSSFLGRIYFIFGSKRKQITLKNLEICFPEKEASWRNYIAKKSIIEFVKTMLEAPYIWRVAKKDGNNLVKRIIGEELLDPVSLKRDGLIILAPHHGCWELIGLFMTSKHPMVTMYRPQKNAVLDACIKKGRQGNGMKVVPTNIQGVRELLRALEQKKIVGILPDHTPKEGEGILAPFFNQPANTPTLITSLASRNKVPVVTMFAKRLSFGRGFDMYVLKVDDDLYSEDGMQSILAVNQAVENAVMYCPEQYFWSYARFRNRGPSFNDLYEE